MGVISSETRGNALRRETVAILERIRAGGILWVCSVVPRLTGVLERAARARGLALRLAGRDRDVPMANRCRYPDQVGMDRLVGAFATWRLYGAPAIVVDLGTAVTLDAVSADGAYLGGIIFPGPDLSARVLHRRTALLPRVLPRRPRRLIGRDTEEGILSGLFFGSGEAVRGVTARLQERLPGARIVVTGGYASWLRSFFEGPEVVWDPHLVFRGLRLLEGVSP